VLKAEGSKKASNRLQMVLKDCRKAKGVADVVVNSEKEGAVENRKDILP